MHWAIVEGMDCQLIEKEQKEEQISDMPLKNVVRECNV